MEEYQFGMKQMDVLILNLHFPNLHVEIRGKDNLTIIKEAYFFKKGLNTTQISKPKYPKTSLQDFGAAI